VAGGFSGSGQNFHVYNCPLLVSTSVLKVDPVLDFFPSVSWFFEEYGLIGVDSVGVCDHQWQADLVDLGKIFFLQQRIQVLVDMTSFLLFLGVLGSTV
jgi:hypothetical protein